MSPTAEIPAEESTLRRAGWLAIASGVLGLIASALLVTAVITRTTWSLSSHVDLLFRAHDLGVVLQFLLLIALVFGLEKLSLRSAPGMHSSSGAWGIGALFLSALLLLLGIGKVVNDMFYILPQGIFGLWLIAVNLRLSGSMPRWLRYFGMVVGFGLVLVGTVFPGLAIFVYPNMLKIPAVPVDQDTFQNTEINRILHLILAAGSLLGVVTLPVWSILTGYTLLAKEPADSRISI